MEDFCATLSKRHSLVLLALAAGLVAGCSSGADPELSLQDFSDAAGDSVPPPVDEPSVSEGAGAGDEGGEGAGAGDEGGEGAGAGDEGGEGAGAGDEGDEVVVCKTDLYLGPLLEGRVVDSAGDLVAPSRVTAQWEGADEPAECEFGLGWFGCAYGNQGFGEGAYQIRVERNGEEFSIDANVQAHACGVGVQRDLEVNVGATRAGPPCAEDRASRAITLFTEVGQNVEGMFRVEVSGLARGVEAAVRPVEERRSISGELEVEVFLPAGLSEGVSVRVMADVTGDWCTLGPADIAFGLLEVPLELTPAEDTCRYAPQEVTLSQEHFVRCGYDWE